MPRNPDPSRPVGDGPPRARARVAVIGGGQLARMTADAAGPLGVDVSVLALPDDDATAGRVADRTVVTALDEAAVLAFAEGADVVTFDHEKVPDDVVRALERSGAVVRPGARALRLGADKAFQRTTLAEHGVPVPPFVVAHDPAGVAAAAATLGGPVVVKRATGGYDGRGVRRVDDLGRLDDLLAGWFDGPDPRVVVEPALPLERELAVLVARRPGGEAAAYPVVETVQDDEARCAEVLVPAPVAPGLAAEARELALRVAEVADAVGVLAVELFVVDGALLVNELAARPHNTGHLTIDACATSQFTNHLLAVLDRPLGPTDLRVPVAVMANVVGAGDDDLGAADRALVTGAADGRVHVHLYGKRSRVGRKLGHVTAVGRELAGTRRRAGAVADHLRRRTVASPARGAAS